MEKEKTDYPIVLTAKHVAEIMSCSEVTARTYIKTVNAKLTEQGKLSSNAISKISRVPRDYFFEIFGI
ncbi:hypothetical protein [Clostridium felsineum]|uniref:hypothetical protein n=1 Tax=Clostridium felsineum TaxID=36839 RepID=UPI00098C39E6|nr:hypothetical protein [Clostridium felsineum]URZ15298.1 hypothetical protein CLFE_013160 [Clostridium felsineum DSM 794]